MDGMNVAGSEGALAMLLSRASNGALRDPAPDASALELIVEAGLRAPDHGKLRPWRFVAIQGDARARFADLAIAALRARDPTATEAEADRMRGKLVSPPLILALGVHVTPAHKVPEIEQMRAVAAAAMNMLNAAHALGYAGKWITGPNSYDPAVAEALGFVAPDRLAGFLYLGTPAQPAMPVSRPDVAAHLTAWSGR
jgi:nitroreductase